MLTRDQHPDYKKDEQANGDQVLFFHVRLRWVTAVMQKLSNNIRDGAYYNEPQDATVEIQDKRQIQSRQSQVCPGLLSSFVVGFTGWYPLCRQLEQDTGLVVMMCVVGCRYNTGILTP
ncbi:MAG TPA: hypothetical protein VKZ92_01700 [Pseudohongiella sp.]|nr:hypothetical protein [Pseudohongiella sp.]